MGFSILARNGLCSLMICWLLVVPAGVPVLVSLLISSFFPQERGSVPSWFAGLSWFRLGFRCLSPFFSLLWFRCLSPFFSPFSFLRKGGLFHHDLLVPLGSGWGSRACLPSSPFFGSGACLPSSLSSGQGFGCIMICWLLLVPAGVPVLVSLLLSSFFPQERGSVTSWFAGSSWFRLGFRCLSPCFSLLSFLRKEVLFHHDLLVLPGPAGVPVLVSLLLSSLVPVLVSLLLSSYLFFLSSGQGFCSIMICWFLLVPAGVPVLVSLLLSSFFPQESGSVPSWFAGSSWFRLGFRCLSPFFSLLWFRCFSPFFSLLSFLRKEVLFHHDLLVLPGPAGVPVLVSLLLSSFFPQERGSVPSWFAGSSWFRLGFRYLSPLLLSSSVPVLVSLLLSSFFPQERGSVPSWFAGSSWFRFGFWCLSTFFSLLWFRCLSPFFSLLSFLRKGVLFHHDLLVPLGSGWGSGACLPSSLFFLSSGKGFCFIMICWFLLVLAGVPVLVSLLLSSFFPQERGSVSSWFAGSSWFRLGFRCLSPCFSLLSFLRKGVLLHHYFLLVPPGSGWGSGACVLILSSLVPVLVSLLLSSLVPVLVSLLLSSWFCSIMICWFLLVPAGVPVLVSPSSLFFGSGACLPASLFFLSSGKGFCSIMICWFLLVPAGVPVLVSLLLSSSVPVLVSLLLSSFFPQERGSVPSWFAGSSWFRLGFRYLSPFFSLLSFLRKGVLFHHGFPGSSCYGLGFRCLSPFFSTFDGLAWTCHPFQSDSCWHRAWDALKWMDMDVHRSFHSLGFFCIFRRWATVSQMEASIFSSICFTRSCVSLVGSHMGLCWRYCSQEKTACTSFGLVWKLRTSTQSGFLNASGRLFYCLEFVRLK